MIEDDCRQSIIRSAMKFLNTNKECFVAQWIVSNPDKNIADYCLVQQNMLDGGWKFYIEERRKLYGD